MYPHPTLSPYRRSLSHTQWCSPFPCSPVLRLTCCPIHWTTCDSLHQMSFASLIYFPFLFAPAHLGVTLVASTVGAIHVYVCNPQQRAVTFTYLHCICFVYSPRSIGTTVIGERVMQGSRLLFFSGISFIVTSFPSILEGTVSQTS